MSVIHYEKRDVDGQTIYILRMRGSPREDGQGFENKINKQFMLDFHAALDRVEKEHEVGSGGAVVTIGEGRHYSDGLDISYLMTLPGVPQQLDFLRDVEKLLMRLLVFRLPTIAAINGHAYAGGFLLALAHDYRIMNSEKGFACMTEIDLNNALTAGMNAVLKEKLPRHLAGRMLLEALRQNAKDLEQHKVVNKAVPAKAVLDEAIAWATMVAPKGASTAMQNIKEDLYNDAMDVLRNDKLSIKGFGKL